MIGGFGKTSWYVVVGVLVAAALPLLFVLPALTEPASSAYMSNAPAAHKAVAAEAAQAPPTDEVPPAEVVPVVPIVPAAPAVVVPPPVVLKPLPVAVPNPSGPEVLALEQRLSSLGYLVGNVDGVMDRATHYGITAFQKVEGLDRSTEADPATLDRLQTAAPPAPMFTTPPDHIEVDIPRQVVFVVRGSRVSAVLPTSTGSNQLFTSQGYTRRAVTPNGQFQIYYKLPGWHTSPLGKLYRPSFFNGGIAFHGALSVPTGPVSHGCVRLPMPFADWFADNAPAGMVVYVYGGPTGDNPQPLLDEPPAGLSQAGVVPLGLPAPPVPVPSPATAPPGSNPLGGLLNGLLPN